MSDHSHGNTPAAWTAVVIIMVAFLFGTIAVVLGNWPMFWIGGVGLAVVGAIVGRVMAGMGYGKTPKSHDAPTSPATAGQ
ncbi:MAG: HGxxPAAW family protein [Candidatus Nanopelagicales bacterium]